MLRPALALCLLGLALGACGSPPSSVTYARYQYTCCLGSDVNRTWRPGETVTVHWIVNEGPHTADQTPHRIVLRASVSGAYSDVGALKSNVAVQRHLQAAAITVDDQTASAAPVSTIVLPSDLQRGLYNLSFEVDFGRGNWVERANVIRVGP